MLGALLYLTMNKPKIAYVVHIVPQFMHKPHTSHLHDVKRILKYLQGTPNHGLFFKDNSYVDLMVAFCDSNWTGCLNSSRSSTEFAIFLGSNLIS